MSEQPREGTLVVLTAPEGELPFNYYASQEKPAKSRFARTGTPGGFFEIDPPRTLRKVTEEKDLEPLKKLVQSGKYKQIVLVQSHEWWADHEQLTLKYLDNACSFLDEQKWEGVAVYRYEVMGAR